MHPRDWRGEREGRTNVSRLFDEVVCTTEIVFSFQVCAFISSSDADIALMPKINLSITADLGNNHHFLALMEQ
jgi:hypothetical protein